MQRCAEANAQRIGELSSRVEQLEEQLVTTTDVADALHAHVRCEGKARWFKMLDISCTPQAIYCEPKTYFLNFGICVAHAAVAFSSKLE